MTPLTTLEAIYCIAVMLLAYGLRGSTGFGGAIGMPLLALAIPIKVLVPVWTLLGFASSIAILGRERRHVAWRAFAAFVPWCLLGVAVGLYLFRTLDARLLARGLGVMVLAYASYSLWGATRKTRVNDAARRVLGPAASIIAGAVGTLFGTMASVFFAMYLDARALGKDAFRATMSAMLLTLSAVRGAGYYAIGEFSREVWLTFAAALPLMLIGIWAGDRIQVRLSEQAFRRIVCGTLTVCGIALLLR